MRFFAGTESIKTVSISMPPKPYTTKCPFNLVHFTNSFLRNLPSRAKRINLSASCGSSMGVFQTQSPLRTKTETFFALFSKPLSSLSLFPIVIAVSFWLFDETLNDVAIMVIWKVLYPSPSNNKKPFKTFLVDMGVQQKDKYAGPSKQTFLCPAILRSYQQSTK